MKGEFTMTLQDYINERSEKSPEFQKEFAKYQPEIECVRALVEARKSLNLTQKELSKLTGIRQSNLSRIENGKCTPTLEMLQKIAAGLGKRVVIQIL